MKSVLQGVWGTPHQAKGGDSSESPPAVFWLPKTLLATFVGNLTLLGESVVPCLHAEAKTSKGNELLQGLFHKACAKFDFITERCLSQSMKLAAVPRKVASLTRYHSKTQYRQILLLRFRKVTAAPAATSIMPVITMLTAPVSGGPTSFSVTVTMHSAT